MVSSYDNSLPPSVYYEGFARLYQAGLTGQSRESVTGGAVERLSPSQRYAAYVSGQNDGAVSLAREQRAARFAKVAGTDSGLVFDEYVERALNEETAEKLNKLAKSLGVRVSFVDNLRGGTANAQLSGSEVQISMDSDSPVTFLLGHEMTHRIQELAPESYRAFRSIVAEENGDQVQAMLDLYRDQGVEISYEQALDEVTANYAGELMQDEATLDRFISEHKDDRTLLQRVRDAIKSLIRKLTGKEKDQAQRAVDKLETALRAAQGQVKGLQEQTTGGTMETKFSLKEDMEHGRREETREAFLRRAVGEGYGVYEGETATYGFRRVRDTAQEGHRGQVARSTKKELTRLGIHAEVIDGTVLVNRNGVTTSREVSDAVTSGKEIIFINQNVDISPLNVAGHEAFHFWAKGKGRDAYIETVEDNLLFASESFQKFQAPIAKAYLGGEADLANETQMEQLREELFAYISGDLHEGTNEAELRGMLRDYDEVKTAWETLVRENSGESRFSKDMTETERGAEEVSFSLKGSENAKELAELRKENEYLRERWGYWKGQTRLTQKGQETVQLEDAKRLARRLVKDYSGTVEVDTVTEGVKGLAEYLLRGGDEMSYEGAKEKALDIAHTIAESALAKDDTYAQEYSSLRQYLKETKLVLGKEYQSDIADYNEWRKHQFGRLNLSSQGETNIDQVYHELSQLYPEFFDEEQVSHPAVKDTDLEALLPSWACSSGTVNL